MKHKTPKTAADAQEILELMYRLGQAYLACGETTGQIELILRRVAIAHGMRHCRVVTFPTAIFITLQSGEQERVTLAAGPTWALRLDQIADVYALGDAAQAGEVGPRDGLTRINAILKKKPRFGFIGIVVGHMVLTAGLAMALSTSLVDLTAAVCLGTIVGALKLLNRGRPVLAVPAPVMAAALVSSLVYVMVRRGVPITPVHVLVPPLITFLPGGMLTMGMVELAYADMIAGTSRLIAGFVQLVLLTFGLAAGAIAVGVGYRTGLPEQAPRMVADYPWEAWVPWVGVIVYGLGIYLHFSAPQKSLAWILLVLLITFATQRTAARYFGTEISGFFGTLVSTPLGYLIQLRFKGPPAMVTFLPSFWLLVPGVLGLLSVMRMLGNQDAAMRGLISAIFAFTSIALGSLMGASLYKAFTERFGWWRLQLGRASSYLRWRGR